VILWVVETERASGEVLPSEQGHFDLWDAVNEADSMHESDKCCQQNTSDDDYIGPCPGGCETRSPRIVEYRAERVEK
jgi:hypothetical protein